MAVRKTQRRGEPRLFLDICYIDKRTGKNDRYRRDAEVQTMAAARAEEREKLALLVQLGYIPDGSPEKPWPTHRGAPAAAPGQAQVEAPAPPPAPAAPPLTFGKAVELLRETKAVTELKKSTMHGYEGVFDAHLLPRWKGEPITGIDREKVEALDTDLAKAGLSLSTRRNAQIALRSVLRCAVERGKLARMPDLPPLPKVGRKVVRPPSKEDVDLVLSLAFPAARLALTIAADAGLRAGEIRGLRWGDIDLKKGVLYVRRTLNYGQEDTPKSGHEREVPLSPRLQVELSAAKKAPEKKTGKAPDPGAPAAPSSRGTPWAQFSLRQAFVRVLAKAELPTARLHDLRHFFVTECFRVGGDAETIRELAGHVDLATTQGYAHTGAARKQDVIRRLAS